MKSNQTRTAEVLERAALDLRKAILDGYVVDSTTVLEMKVLQSALNLVNDVAIAKRNQANLALNDWK